jgi:hypothetical protein
MNKNIFLLIFFFSEKKRLNSFFYGNPWESDPSIPRLFPLVCSKLNEMIKFESSVFKLN